MGASNTLRSVQGIPRKLAAVQMKQSGWGDGGGEPVGFVFFFKLFPIILSFRRLKELHIFFRQH